MAEKNQMKEAEKLLKKVGLLYGRYWQISLKLKTRPLKGYTNIFKLVPQAKALERWEIKKELDKLDPQGMVRYLLSISFTETEIMFKIPKEYQKNVKSLLEKIKKESSVRLIALALKAGWLKPLR